MSGALLFEARTYRNEVSKALNKGTEDFAIADPTLAEIPTPIVYACGLGGSYPIAAALCATLRARGHYASALDIDTLDQTPIGPLVTFVLVSASGSHPSLLRFKERIRDQGGSLRIMTLAPTSSLAQQAPTIAPTVNVYADEFLSLRNTLSFAKLLDLCYPTQISTSTETAPPNLPYFPPLSHPTHARPCLIVYDGNAKAPAFDLAMRCRETRMQHVGLQHRSELVHGGFASLARGATILCLGGHKCAELAQTLSRHSGEAYWIEVSSGDAVLRQMLISISLHRVLLGEADRFDVARSDLSDALWTRFR